VVVPVVEPPGPAPAQLPAPLAFPVVAPVVPVVAVVPVEPGAASREASPCRLWAGHALRLIRIFTYFPLPVRWQIHIFFRACLSAVVVVPVELVDVEVV
jgi:hypothetical protein